MWISETTEKKDKEYLDKVNNEQTEVILKLNEQIEKMKCCGNCRHNGSDRAIGENGDYADYTCIQCDDLSTKENPYPNWELM